MLALALALLAAPQEAEASPPSPEPPGRDAVTAIDLADARATLTVAPTEVEVGEPMVWTLDVVHPAGVEPVLSDDELGLGSRYVVLEASGTVTKHGTKPGQRRTRKSWTVVALGATQVLPSLEVRFGEGEGAPSILTSEGELRVRSVLGGDDGARPAKGFRDPLAESDGPTVPWLVAAIVVPVVLGLLALVLRGRRRRRAERAPAPLPPLERLAQLEQSVSTDLPSLQALHYSLTALLRDAVDARLGASRSPLTDREWLSAVEGDGRLAPDVRRALAVVVARAEEVKYARQKPTRFAVDETLRTARGALEGATVTEGAA